MRRRSQGEEETVRVRWELAARYDIEVVGVPVHL
jgi:hypothetical protein